MPAGLPIELRERIVRAHVEHGLSPEEVAELFGVGRTSVLRFIAKHRRGEPLEPGRAPGGTPKLGDTELTWLRGRLEEDPYLTSYELTAKYNRAFPKNRVHRSTILRAMHTLGFTHKKRPPSPRNASAPT